jgi:hypothetical protein
MPLAIIGLVCPEARVKFKNIDFWTEADFAYYCNYWTIECQENMVCARLYKLHSLLCLKPTYIVFPCSFSKRKPITMPSLGSKMTNMIEELNGLFDNCPTLDTSLQDFNPRSSKLRDSVSERESVSGRGYSPPAWRRTKNGMRSSGFWRSSDNVLGKRSRASRDSSPEYENADEKAEGILAAAARTRLPTGSSSPEKRRSPSPDPFPTSSGDVGASVKEEHDRKMQSMTPAVSVPENPNNCMYQSIHR